ncbi:MAG: outer membrane beta-barrel protein [Candidatus Acidiferrales bacterium]
MRLIVLASLLLLAAAPAARAQDQDAVHGDAALTYHWVRSNTSAGECGCFNLNGGGLSGSWEFHPRIAAVAEISAENATGVLADNKSLTLTSYLAGARYWLPQPWPSGAHSPEPFAQVLLGAVHAGGGIAGTGDGAYSFATRIGGGLDLPVTSRFELRLIQVDYYLTHSVNATNDHQNNLLVGAGIVFRWSRGK